jgi:hypothetical protein
MVAVASCFAQILALIDRTEFARAVRQHAAERATKGFGCWDHFVAMLFGQMGSAHSLREICGGLATALGKLVHLGVRRTPTRSTLAYANAHRPWQLYETLFYQVLTQCQAVAALKRRRFRFKHPLRTLDTTIIELCATVFDWARFQRTKGAIKLHLQLDHQGCLPCWALVTDGDTNDVRVAQQLTFAPGTIVAIDRGYLDYALYHRWTVTDVGFVTRPRTNMLYEVLERRPVPARGPVLADEVIRLTGLHAADRCPVPLRQVLIWDEKQQRRLTFLTNLMHLAASTIAAIYKERWQIEILFKALKHHLKIKTFVGTSENAVQVQIWVALIAMVLLKFLQLKSTWPWSLSNLAALLRFNLLTYRDLWAWLNAPFRHPVIPPTPLQATLFAT